MLSPMTQRDIWSGIALSWIYNCFNNVFWKRFPNLASKSSRTSIFKETINLTKANQPFASRRIPGVQHQQNKELVKLYTLQESWLLNFIAGFVPRSLLIGDEISSPNLLNDEIFVIKCHWEHIKINNRSSARVSVWTSTCTINHQAALIMRRDDHLPHYDDWTDDQSFLTVYPIMNPWPSIDGYGRWDIRQ